MKLGDIVKEYRATHKLSMEKFAILAGVSKGYISMLEKGENPRTKKPISPSFDTIKNIALAMNRDFEDLVADLDDTQKISITPPTLRAITETAEKLEEPRQVKVLNFAKNELDDQQESEKARQKLQQGQNEGQKPKVGENTSLINLDEKRAEYEVRKTVPKSINSEVSAGTGVVGMDLDEEHSFYLDSIPDDYDYIVKVKGDSMRPVMADGDFLFVKETPQVDTNAIGIFQINGENYVKKLRLTPNYIYYLESINPDYDDIYFHEDDTIRTIGEVVDVYREG